MGIGLHTVPVVLQFVSFALLLVATISAPAVQQLPLAQNDNVKYGVFGVCSSSGCSAAKAIYKVSSYTKSDDWFLKNETRDNLSGILIVIPVASFLSLVSFGFAVASHISSVMSPAFFIIELVVTVLSFIAAALVCVITILIFYPYTTYGSWILVPAAVWPLISCIFVVLALLRSKREFDIVSDDDNDVRIDKMNNTDFDNVFNASYDNNLNESSNTYGGDIPPLTEKSLATDDSYYDNKSSNQENVKPTDFTNNFLPPLPKNQMGNTNNRNDSFETAQSQLPPADSNISNIAPYPHNDEFNFTPVPQSGFQPETRTYQNQYTRNVSQQTAPNGVRMPSSVYPESNYGTIPGSSASATPQKNMYMEEDGYYQPNITKIDDEYNMSDTNSDFTSVSQRPTNPLYYQRQSQSHQQPQQQSWAPQNSMNNVRQPPQQQGYAMGPQSQPQQQQPPQQVYNTGPSAGPMGPQTQVSYAPQGQMGPPPVQQGPSKSDLLLNSNPEFSLGHGSAPRVRPGFRRPGPTGKKPGQMGNFTAASLSKDSPYNLR